MLPKLTSYLVRLVAPHMPNWGSNTLSLKTFFGPANTFLLINMSQASAAAYPPLRTWSLPPNNTVVALSFSMSPPSSSSFATRSLLAPLTCSCQNPSLNGRQPIVVSMWITTTLTMVFLQKPNSATPSLLPTRVTLFPVLAHTIRMVWPSVP